MNSNAPDPVVIVGAKRTAIGNFQGSLSSVSAPELGAVAIKAALEESKLAADAVEEVIFGCVLPAGIGQAPARQASKGAGIPDAAGATTVNKMCGSGMKAIMMAADGLLSGSSKVSVAGGMENMSKAPYILPKAREGYRLGNQTVADHMFLDGLEDAYEPGVLMGVFAERTATKYNFSREQQDEFAIRSLQRARQATESGASAREIAPVTVKNRGGETRVAIDELPQTAEIEKIPGMRPAFVKDGTVTAANSSSISDGAAAVVLMRESEAQKRGLKPLARILASSSHSQEPQWFTTAPVGALKKVLAKIEAKGEDIDLFEVNEAFAVVAMAAMRDHGIPAEKINVYGGACALGHPVGASGARILVTLLNALRSHGLKTGVAGLCIGGGEAVAMAVELL